MAVPFFDLTRQHQRLRELVLARASRVFESQQFILGQEVERFEMEFAAAVGAPYAVGMSSGTDAELALLMALGLGHGDAVVTTPFTFFSTAGCLARLGIEPVFADIDPGTFLLDPAAVREAVGEVCVRDLEGRWRTASGNVLRALIPVHLFGLACDMDAMDALAAELGLRVVEDAAQAVGAAWKGAERAAQAGAWAEAGFFSFFPTKNLGGAGDGGMAVCHEANLAQKLREIRNHGMGDPYRHAQVGGNFRLDALQAAILSAKLPFLPEFNAARRRHARMYVERLAGLQREGVLTLPPHPDAEPGRHVFHQFVIRARDREALRQFLAQKEIGTGVYYPLPLHLQPVFKKMWQTHKRSLPAAEAASKEVLALPIFPELEEEEINQVCQAIEEFYRVC